VRAAKVVYHLVDAERVGLALGNLRNHVVGAGGPAPRASPASCWVRR